MTLGRLLTTMNASWCADHLIFHRRKELITWWAHVRCRYKIHVLSNYTVKQEYTPTDAHATGLRVSKGPLTKHEPLFLLSDMILIRHTPSVRGNGSIPTSISSDLQFKPFIFLRTQNKAKKPVFLSWSQGGNDTEILYIRVCNYLRSGSRDVCSVTTGIRDHPPPSRVAFLPDQHQHSATAAGYVWHQWPECHMHMQTHKARSKSTSSGDIHFSPFLSLFLSHTDTRVHTHRWITLLSIWIQQTLCWHWTRGKQSTGSEWACMPCRHGTQR